MADIVQYSSPRRENYWYENHHHHYGYSADGSPLSAREFEKEYYCEFVWTEDKPKMNRNGANKEIK